MSKINININGKKVGEIENKIVELNKYFVLVEKDNIEKLNQANISYNEFKDDYFIVRRGKKPKKFNAEQVQAIKKDLEELSIRQCAKKYDTSTRIIQDIKQNKY